MGNAPLLIGLTQLEWFSISGPSIATATWLTNMTRLNTLQFYGTVRDVRPLLSFTNLTSLNLGGNPLTNAPWLGQLHKLTLLGLNSQGQAFLDLSWIPSLTNLTELALNHNPRTDLSPLAALPRVRGNGGLMVLTDPSPILPQRFYRVREQ